MKIVEIRRLTDEETEQFFGHVGRGHSNPQALVLQNGNIMFPSADEEMNHGGQLFEYDEEDDSLYYHNPD